MLIYVAVFTEMMPGGDQLQMKEAPGETLAEKSLTVMIAVTAMIAVVTAVTVVMTAVTESAEMTVNLEALPEVMRRVSSVATLSCL